MKKKTTALLPLFFRFFCFLCILLGTTNSFASETNPGDGSPDLVPLPTLVESITLKHPPREIKSMQKVAFYGAVPQGTPDGAKITILFIGIGIDAYGTVEASVSGEKFSRELLLEEPGDYWVLATLQNDAPRNRQDTSPKIRVTVTSGDLSP